MTRESLEKTILTQWQQGRVNLCRAASLRGQLQELQALAQNRHEQARSSNRRAFPPHSLRVCRAAAVIVRTKRSAVDGQQVGRRQEPRVQVGLPGSQGANMKKDERFGVVANTTNFLQAEECVEALREAGIESILRTHGREDADRLTSASPEWFEILVASSNAQHASELVQRTEAPIEAELPLSEPEAEDSSTARPESVRMAGYFYFTLLGLAVVVQMLYHHYGLSLNPGDVVAGEVSLVLIGYALIWGPNRRSFWIRVRTLAAFHVTLSIAVLLLSIGAFTVFAYEPGATSASWSVLSLGALMSALVGKLGIFGRRFVAAVFGVGVLGTAISAAQTSSLYAAAQAVTGEWSDPETGVAISLCPDGASVEKRPAGEPLTGRWTAAGDGSNGVVTIEDGQGETRRYGYSIIQPPEGCGAEGCNVKFSGTLFERDRSIGACLF